MGAVILDASVLIGLLDESDAHHTQAVDDVERADIAGDALVTSASTYSEVLVAFAHADRLDDAREALSSMGISVVAMTQQIAERAAVIRARHRSLRLPDAMVLATAHEHDGQLLTYDTRLARAAAH